MIKYTLILASLFLLIGTSEIRASGTEVKGVVYTQPVQPGDYMNPVFSSKVDINIHFPSSPNANTGLLVVLHGLGTHFHQYDTECETWVNDFNVLTVQVNYRGTGNPPPGYDLGKFQAIDVLRVVQYMLANYTLDRCRIFLWGASAGGNVALHTAKMAPGTFALVAALHPITRPTNDQDRTNRHYENDPLGGWEKFILGTGLSYTTEEWDIRDAQYLAAFMKDVPVYLIHGDKDNVVDWQHSKDLHDVLQNVGGNSSLITIPGGGHEFGGALDPTENSRFKVTQKYLKTPINTLTTSGKLELDTQAKITFPTRGSKAWPVKFDPQGLATLDQVDIPGAVMSLRVNGDVVKQGESLSFSLKLDNWTPSTQSVILLAGFFRISNSSVWPLVGPTPFLLTTSGVSGSVGIPITTAFPTGEYLFVAVVLGSTPSNYIDLDYFQFTITPGS